MIVKEVIKELQKFPEDSIVRVLSETLSEIAVASAAYRPVTEISDHELGSKYQVVYITSKGTEE